MSEILWDIASAVPASSNGALLPINIPVFPGVVAAQVTIEVPDNGGVELFASLGIGGTSGTSVLRVRFYRDGSQIFFGDQAISTAVEQFYMITVLHIDLPAPPGVHTYSLTVEKLGAGNQAAIAGPIVLNAMSIGPLE